MQGQWIHTMECCDRVKQSLQLQAALGQSCRIFWGLFYLDREPQGNVIPAKMLAGDRMSSGWWEYTSDQNLETRQFTEKIMRQSLSKAYQTQQCISCGPASGISQVKSPCCSCFYSRWTDLWRHCMDSKIGRMIWMSRAFLFLLRKNAKMPFSFLHGPWQKGQPMVANF